MPTPILLDDVIAPLSRERFVSDYWTKSHLHAPGEKDRFRALFDWEALNRILEWQNPSPERIKLFRDGRPLDSRIFIDGEGPGTRLNAGGLIASLADGASLVMDDLQEIVPELRALAGTFQDFFFGPVIVNLYAGWGRQNAFPRHWDPQEVFILQLSGRKHWALHAPTRSHPLRDDPTEPPEPKTPPLWEGVLKQGDMLYMPRGTWHLVTPLDEPSLHLNFAVAPPNGADFLRWWMPRLLEDDELRRNLPLGSSGTLRQDYFAGVLEKMASDGRGRDRANEFLREWNAYRRAHPSLALPLAPARQKAPLAAGTRIRLAQRDGLYLEPVDAAAVRFRAVGRVYTVAAQLAPALQRLNGRDGLAVGELCAGLGDPRLGPTLVAALETMARDGVILKD